MKLSKRAAEKSTKKSREMWTGREGEREKFPEEMEDRKSGAFNDASPQTASARKHTSEGGEKKPRPDIKAGRY